MILGIDPAKRTGWATDDGRSGVWQLQGELGEQHVQLSNLIDSMGLKPSDTLAVENAGFGSRNPAVQAMHNERLGVIRAVAAKLKLKVLTFHPTTIKAFVCKGSANKASMISAVKKHFGKSVTDDNEADAVCIVELARRPDCWPQKKLKRKSAKTKKLKAPKVSPVGLF